jgi:hypothetical protein
MTKIKIKAALLEMIFAVKEMRKSTNAPNL